MLYELTDTDVQNLKIFLDRVSLSGKEALPYLQLLQKLNSPKNETIKQPLKDEQRDSEKVQVSKKKS